MKRRRVERSPLYPKIMFGFTDHPITVWAGVILLRIYFEWIKLREELSVESVTFTKRSNNQVPAVDVLLGWFYGLALGAERFEQFTRYRGDGLLGALCRSQRLSLSGHMRRLFLRLYYPKLTGGAERV